MCTTKARAREVLERTGREGSQIVTRRARGRAAVLARMTKLVRDSPICETRPILGMLDGVAPIESSCAATRSA